MEDIIYKRLEVNDIENVIIEYKKENMKKFLANKENYLFIGIKDNTAIAFGER